MSKNQQDLVIVTGLSGAGKSTTLKALEDMGYHCIDNLPAGLLKDLGPQMLEQPALYGKVALGIDVRAPGLRFEEIPAWLAELERTGVRARMLFLNADDETLFKRFSETRRKHPLAENQGALQASIAKERKMLEPMRGSADWEVDTSNTNIHELRHQTWKCIGADSSEMTVICQSFGFSKGVPPDADFVFDVRSLPNPYWDPELRALSGRDEQIQEWLGEQEAVGQMRDDITAFLRTWLPGLQQTHRSFVTVAIGCTGGHHRSVFLTEQLADGLRNEFPEIRIHHRDLQT